MKLFLTWLVGVPLLVASLVAMPAVSRIVTPDRNARQECLFDDQQYGMALTVTDQGQSISCNWRAIKQ
jgi:hypothetical protein